MHPSLAYMTLGVPNHVVAAILSGSDLNALSIRSQARIRAKIIELLPSNHWVGANVMKNWLPFELGPELAIDKIPAPVCFKSLCISSSNCGPYIDPPPRPENMERHKTHGFDSLHFEINWSFESYREKDWFSVRGMRSERKMLAMSSERDIWS